MMDDRTTTTAGSMAAAADDPVIGVHVLTKFVYCPRAGLVAFEARGEDLGEDIPPPRLDYVPRYDLQRMKRELNGLFTRLWLQLAGGLVLGGVAWALRDQGPLWLCGAFIGGVLWFGSTRRWLMRIWNLSGELRAAESAVPRMPDADSTEMQPVNWWELLNAGCISKRYEDNLRDDDWKLAGRPWRVLAYGSLRIPVFRQHHVTGGLHEQHFARMAAYCHLIECCTGMRCPYGIILFAYTYVGVTVANSASSRKAFHEGLRRARRAIRAARTKVGDPPPPQDASRCRHCPIGEPVVVQGGWHAGIFSVRGRGFRRYHSACGDRFQWMPPHERVNELRLRPPN